MTTEQDIVKFIISTVASHPNIRGASLGAKVKQHFPGIVIGKLTQFIQRHCGDSVVAIDKVNLDYIWALKQNGVAPIVPDSTSFGFVSISQEKGAVTNSESANETAWKVFTRPDAMRKIAINPETAQIKVVKLNEDVVQPFIGISSVTQDEYQNITLEFVNQLPEPDRQRFKSIAESPGFENQWYESITSWKEGLYAKTWGTFRFEALCSIFIRRLVEKGVGESYIGSCLENLKRIKARKTAIYRDSPQLAGIHSRRPSEFGNLSIREVLAIAVESLNEDDLRRVWLPVGVVLDAIRKQ